MEMGSLPMFLGPLIRLSQGLSKAGAQADLKLMIYVLWSSHC